MRTFLALAAWAVSASGPLLAQCAMCYQNAAAQGSKGIQALNLGILALLIPPLAIMSCISWVAYQRRDR